MTSEVRTRDRLNAIARGARRIDELEQELSRRRALQDADIVMARQEGAPWSEIVAADGRSRQMLNRVIRAAAQQEAPAG